MFSDIRQQIKSAIERAASEVKVDAPLCLAYMKGLSKASEGQLGIVGREVVVEDLNALYDDLMTNFQVRLCRAITELAYQSYILDQEVFMTIEQRAHTAIDQMLVLLYRDLGYLVNDAYQYGRATAYERLYGVDVEVCKEVRSNCISCRELFQNEDQTLRVFKLSELKRNGLNCVYPSTVDGDKGHIKPVIGSTSTRCRCELQLKR